MPETRALYIVVQVVAAIAGVWVAHLMFDQAFCRRQQLMRALDQVPSGSRKACRDLWPGFCHPRTACVGVRAKWLRRNGRSVHNGGVLVHGIDQLRQPCSDDRPNADGYVFRHPSAACAGIYCRADLVGRSRYGACDVVNRYRPWLLGPRPGRRNTREERNSDQVSGRRVDIVVGNVFENVAQLGSNSGPGPR